MVTLNNFFVKSEVTFESCDIPTTEPNYVSYGNTRYCHKGDISSTYWYGTDFGGEYVIRKSTHWVKIFTKNDIISHCERIKNCMWHFKGERSFNMCGKAYLKNFKEI